jgi:hypothetical protein
MILCNKFIKSFILIFAIIVCNVSYAEPCGEVPIDKEYRVVLLIDGSGSMSKDYNNLWNPVLDAVHKQIDNFPEGTELQILVFNSTAAGTTSEKATIEQFPPQKLDNQSRDRAKRFMGRLANPKGGTPFYYSLKKVIESQHEWLKEDPAFRYGDVIIYVDGEDLSTEMNGAKGFKNDGKTSSKNIITLGTINELMIALNRDKTDLGLKIDISLVKLIPNIEGIVGVGEIGAGKTVPVPHPVSISSQTQVLPEVKSSKTEIVLDLDIMCPDWIDLSNSRLGLRAKSNNPKIGITPEVSSLDMKNDNYGIRLGLNITGSEALIANGFAGELFFDYPSNESYPLVGNKKLPFTVAAKRMPPVVSKTKLKIKPSPAIARETVELDYLLPIAESIPHWSRKDGGKVDRQNEWKQATTTFENPGNYKVDFSVTRDGLTSEVITVSIPVVDFDLKIEQVTKNPVDTSTDVKFRVSCTGAKPISYDWKVEGAIVQNAIGNELAHKFSQSGKQSVEVRGLLRLGTRELYTRWFKTSIDIDESKAIYVNLPQVHSWARPLSIEAYVDGNIQDLNFQLLNADGQPVGALVTKQVQQTMQSGGYIDKTAAVQLEVPELSGKYKVKVSSPSPSVDPVVMEIELTEPLFKVTLDNPPIAGHKIFVGTAETFQLTLTGPDAVAVDRVTYSIFNQSGADQPEPLSKSNHFRVSFDVILPSNGSIVHGETSISDINFYTAKGTELKADNLKKWNVAANYPTQPYEIIDGKETQVIWGDARVFEVTPPDKNIKSVDWKIYKDGKVVHELQGLTIQYKFEDMGPGQYEIKAVVHSSVSGIAPTNLPVIHRILSKFECEHEIQDGGGETNKVNWGDNRVFSVTSCEQYVDTINWIVKKNGHKIHSETNTQLEYKFDRNEGIYDIEAEINYSIPETNPKTVKTSRTVSSIPGTSSIDFKTREIRGTSLFEGTILTTGSVLSVEIEFTPTNGGETKTTGLITINSSGATPDTTHFSSELYEYNDGEALGEIQAVLIVKRPGSEPKPSGPTFLLHRHPPSWGPFLTILFSSLAVFCLLGKIFHNNSGRLWALVVASKYENILMRNDPGSTKLRVKSYHWKRWNKTVQFNLSKISSKIEQFSQEESPGPWMLESGEHTIEIDKKGHLAWQSTNQVAFDWLPQIQVDPDHDTKEENIIARLEPSPNVEPTSEMTGKLFLRVEKPRKSGLMPPITIDRLILLLVYISIAMINIAAWDWFIV